MRLPRLRLRSSLRTLLLLIAVFALWLGWRVNRAHRQRNAIAEVEKYNGHVRFDYEFANGKEIPKAQPWAPNWLRRALGDDYFREVSRISYVDQPLSDATLAPLSELNAIDRLTFLTRPRHRIAPVNPPPKRDRLTEEGLARLEGLTRLRFLWFWDIDLSGPALRHLDHSSQMDELRIFDGKHKPGITDEGMPPFGTMPRLRILTLVCGRITGSCLEPLRGSGSLEELNICGSPLSTAAFEVIGTLTNLKRLNLDQVGVSDTNLSALQRLTGLTHLDLSYPSMVTDAGLVRLAGMTQLESLNLTGCKLLGTDLSPLREMKQLKSLSLGLTQVNDTGLEVIAGFPKLEILALDGTEITDAGLVHLRGLKNLTELSVGRTKVSKKAAEDLQESLPQLGKVQVDF